MAAPFERLSIRNWSVVRSVIRAVRPPSASISRTICPLATPPTAGLHDMLASLVMSIVRSSVREPMRAAAEAASQPAWPPADDQNIVVERHILSVFVFGIANVARRPCGRSPRRTGRHADCRRRHFCGVSQNRRYLSSLRCICRSVRGVLSRCPQRCSSPCTTTRRISCKVVAP